MTDSSAATATCPRCSTPVPEGGDEWRFCAACGAPLAGAACGRCSAPLVPGALFCHRCGAAMGGGGPPASQQQPRTSGLLAWGVAGIALLALLALLAVRGLNRERGGNPAASLNALPQAGIDFAPAGGTVRGPDISQLSPGERADRLYNRVMMLAGEGKRDEALAARRRSVR